MAIDFYVMPFSRYLSGDFITPTMRFAWEQGVPYAIVGPDGTRVLPQDQPFGGEKARERRDAVLPLLDHDLTSLPVGHQLWNERSEVEPRFHRVDAESYAALLEEMNGRRGRPSFLGFLGRAQPVTPHATATIFLPCAFDTPFPMSTPVEGVTGSIDVAIRELSSITPSDRAGSARDTLLDALRDANELNLPMIVDM
jgi:hypothetical protein